MRVLHVHSGNLYGGVETLLVTLWRERAASGDLNFEYALCFEGRLAEELRAEGARVHALGAVRASRPLGVRRARHALARVLCGGEFDAVVCHSSWSQALFGRTVVAAGSPLVFWLHDAVTGRHWLERWARLSEPALVVANSLYTAKAARRLYARPRVEVLYCPVSPGSVAATLGAEERALLRAGLGAKEGETVIVQVGRMEPLKGHATHFEALGLLRDVPGWVCWQVGGAQRAPEREYVEGLKRRAARLGIEGRVRFVGERADVGRLLAAADVYCQPNTSPESFGLTFVEAMHARLPVVTTPVGGAREIIDDTCGLLVPPADANALAAALRQLISDGGLRARLGACGPARARALCDPSAQLRRLGELFGGLGACGAQAPHGGGAPARALGEGAATGRGAAS